MEIVLNDFSFSLFGWQFFVLFSLIIAIWAAVLLAKDQKEPLSTKILVFVSFFIIPLLSSVFYIMHYYSKRKNIHVAK
ncbi:MULTISPECIES: hypothetical protein [unclassified Flavobacterium]|uniref:hypothetical protein n=1 Tax=unclassified Flavobacterium TaxID=196869 RepID=UPI0013D80BD5|nr:MULTISPECIES: hypothetical protein [unclassified Flavobacterium]MBA5792439.1 hypothetical protein [Flavobacterium sp. xlx-221]